MQREESVGEDPGEQNELAHADRVYSCARTCYSPRGRVTACSVSRPEEQADEKVHAAPASPDRDAGSEV
jgi:hypothetical protein